MKTVLIALLVFPMYAIGALSEYRLSQKNGITFKLPYTLGTHEGSALIEKGQLYIDPESPLSANGEFSVTISEMTTGNSQRDCHMREALGLDYSQSDFPREHVCDDSDKLPGTGKNAIVFPQIIFKILSLKSLDKSRRISMDHETPIEVEGQWTIHGVSQKEKIPMKIIPEGEKLRIQGEATFSLKAYNIVVKSVKVLFVTISVKDEVKANFNLLFEKTVKLN